ncbi:MAG: tannase/feruloyl esterase family alpha/beta hydrolase [Vicinamibacteria bacterium]
MRATALVFAAILVLGRGGLSAAEDGAAACAAMKTLAVPGVVLEITATEWFPAGSAPPPMGPMPAPSWKLPAYCRIDGMIDRRQGAEGKPYGIGFAVALPDEWNGRLLMQGGGGLNGRVGFPAGAAAAGETPALVRGFAVAATDSGHQSPGAFDAGFLRDQQAAIDFAFAAVPAWRSSRRRSSRAATGARPTTRTSRAARRAGARA